MKSDLPTSNNKVKVQSSFNATNSIFFLTILGLLIIVIVVAIDASKDNKRYFSDQVWTKESCEGFTPTSKLHPCYVLGSDSQCPLDLTPYTWKQYRGIDFYVQSENLAYIEAFHNEVDLMYDCSLNFALLLRHAHNGERHQPHILLLDNYIDSKWAHYSSGSASCPSDKRIVFPNYDRLAEHSGVLIHEIAHYLQDILWGFNPVTDNCDVDLFSTIVDAKYNDPEWGDGMKWPYCYGLDDGTPGVPNRIELMAILTEGVCALTHDDTRYNRVCGPSAAYLNSGTSQATLQHECLTKLYDGPIHF